MKIKTIELKIKGQEIKCSGKTTRAELIEMLGEPDDVYQSILMYEGVAFHFEEEEDDSHLYLILLDEGGVISVSVPLY